MYLPSDLSLKAANGTRYKLRSGTMTISGSVSRSATGVMMSLEHKLSLLVVSGVSSPRKSASLWW